MGCSGSKLEDLDAVVLCRGRTDHLANAIRHRYALADAHDAYAGSLRSAGVSLHRFLDSFGGLETLAASAASASSSSPVLTLPTQRKGDPSPSDHRHHHSDSGSHIQFHSSDSDAESDSDSPLHSEDPTSPIQHLPQYQPQNYYENLVGPTFNLNFARNQPQPSTVHFADPSSSSPTASAYFNNYGNDPYSYPYSYPATNNYYGFLGNSSSSPPPNLAPPAQPFNGESSNSTSKAPPPPPSPPRVSTWDFLNPFEVGGGQDGGNYYPSYPPSRSSREVRDEEGIPDLEEDEEEHEVVKEVYGEEKFVGSSAKEKYNGEGEGISAGREKTAEVLENDEDVVEKNVVADEGQSQQNVAATAASSKARRYQTVLEIGSEIRVQFEKASDAAGELSKMLEVGKHPYRYHKKSSVIEVSMMCVMPSSSTSNGEDFLNLEEDIIASSKNLSSTLQKLYIWEKKLQDEVRAEERTRLLHEKTCQRLKHLAERGAEGPKLEEVEKLIKKLSTKIRIAIQVVNSISNRISKLRDEELWPQINDLIKGLVKMWKVMLQCHRIQCQAISEAKGIDSITSGSNLDDNRLSAIMDLDLELMRLTGNFASWISAQKNYVKALNGWLELCLHIEPEVTADGVAPYSPGRIGAPPVFVICNYWSQAMDRISEMEVIIAMKAFSTNLRHLWGQHSVNPRQKMMANGDADRTIRARERELQIINKEVDALNEKLVLVTGQNDLPDYSAEVSSLHVGLKQIFEALENFTANSLKAYEELQNCSEEEKQVRENVKLSG